jgi:hypothetical protein
MDIFLNEFDLSKCNQEDINQLSRFIASNEIETLIKSLPTKKSPGLDGITTKFYQTVKEELTPTLLKLCHKIGRGGMLPKSFYEAILP